MSNQSISEEFKSYNEEYLEVLETTLASGRQKKAKVLLPLKDYYLFINFLVVEKNVFNTMPTGFKTLLSKGALDILGVHSTLSAGCINPSVNIVRSLFESSINMKYINRDFEKLMTIYEDYSDFMKYEKWEKDKDLLDFSPEEIEALKKKYEEVKQNYKSHNSWYFKPLKEEMKTHAAFKDWDNKRPSFRAMCVITDQQEMYSSLYNSTSESVHGSSLVQTLFTNEKRNISIAPNFTNDTIELLATMSIIFLSTMVEIGLKRQIEKGYNECSSLLDFNMAFVAQHCLSK